MDKKCLANCGQMVNGSKCSLLNDEILEDTEDGRFKIASKKCPLVHDFKAESLPNKGSL